MSTENLIDLNTINALKEMLEDSFDELFVVFKENSIINVENLKKAYEAENIQDMLSYAHVLKGSCGSLGLTALYKFMENLEVTLRTNENADVSSIMTELESIYSGTIAELIENGFIEA